MLTWLRTFLKSNTWHTNLWFYLFNTLFRKPVGSPGPAPSYFHQSKLFLARARARGAGIMPENQIMPQMSAFHWFSADLSDIIQSNSPGPRPEMVQVLPPSPRPSLFSSEDPTLARLLPRLSSPDLFFLGLPPQGPLSGVHILNPMTALEPRDDPPTPGLAPRRTALPIPIPRRALFPSGHRCEFRTHRVQPDGTYRCTRDGATFIPSLAPSNTNSLLGGHVCTRHRALARRYTEMHMSWTYDEPRQSLDPIARGSGGRFGPTPAMTFPGSGVYVSHVGSQAAVITLFKSDFLDQQPIDWHLAESGTTCPICLDEENPAITLPHVRLHCGHGIHLRCLSDFVLSGAVDLTADTVPCPLCRGDILPDIVQLRHHLLHMKVVKWVHGRGDQSEVSHPLRDLVFEDGHDPSTLETMVDQEIRAFWAPGPASGPIRYVSSKNPTVICQNWEELNVDTITDPTEEIIEMVRPTTPIHRPAPPPAEQTTPPAFVNLIDSPPPTPRPDRRVRRRLVGAGDHRDIFPVVQLLPETRARVEEIPGTSTRVIGVNLSAIDRQMVEGPFTWSGASLSGNTRFSMTVLDVLVPGTGTTQQHLSITIEDSDNTV